MARRQLRSGRDADRAEVLKNLLLWQCSNQLAGIRDQDALANLPAAERAACQKPWADVAALRKEVEKRGK